METARPKVITVEGFSIQERMPIPPEAAGMPVRLCGEHYDIPLTEAALSKGILELGTIGSGKTCSVEQTVETVVRRMKADDVMIVFDVKGDFYRRFYRPGIDAVISNDDTATTAWNVFREILADGPAKAEANAMEIVNGWFDDKIARSNAPFFPQAARDVLLGILTYIYRTLPAAEQNNEELYLYLRDATMQDVIDSLDGMADLRGLIDYLCGGQDSEESQGVYSELRSVINELLVGSFREKGDFSVRQFVRERGGRILFLEYDMAVGTVLCPMFKTLMDLAIKETLSRRSTGAAGSVYYVIDELKLLPRLRHLTDGINLGRSLNARFLVATQNVRQIIEAYGPDQAYSVLSAFGTVVAFKVTDKATLQFVQDRYGAARKRLVYPSRDWTRTDQDQLINGHAVEDWDLLSLPPGQAILSVGDYSPQPVRFTFKHP